MCDAEKVLARWETGACSAGISSDSALVKSGEYGVCKPDCEYPVAPLSMDWFGGLVW